jgi:pimeloyl-ACP methyl ester carboxylesterase
VPIDGADTLRTTHLGELDVTYTTAGSGPRLVLIHGLAQDHTIWTEVQHALADYTTVSYDLRGHGDTTLGAADGTLAQLADDLASLLEEVGPAICVGFSLGGAIALWAAAVRPDLVTGVVAVATSSVVGRAAEASLAERIEQFRAGGVAGVRGIILADTVSQLGTTGPDAEAITESRMRAIGDGAGYVNGAEAVRSMRVHSLNERLPEIPTRVLVVSGELDQWCPRRAAEIMLEQLPSATFIELPGIGHLVTDDDPDGLAAVIRTWLESED